MQPASTAFGVLQDDQNPQAILNPEVLLGALRARMEANIFSDEAVARRLVVEHVPLWAGLPIRRLLSSGTDNALYRLGDDLLLRFPSRESAVQSMRKELEWLPFLADLPLIVPHVRFRGRADIGVMCDFAVVDWLEGEDAFPDNIDDPVEAARDLAGFLKALHAKGTKGAPLADRRGAALETLSSAVLPAIDVLADEIDAGAARELWHSACAAAFRGGSVWLHGDLKADNLIASGGRLRAVIDWGLCAVGDPAVDYAAAWTWVEASARDIFCDACELVAEDRLRAKGWALYSAVIALSYYRDRGSHDALCSQSRRTLAHLELSIGTPCADSIRGR